MIIALFALLSFLSLHGSAEHAGTYALGEGREGRGGRYPLIWLGFSGDVRAQALD